MTEFEKSITNFNQQLNVDHIKYFNTEKLKSAKQRTDGIIIAGMGGSGLAGRILRDIRHEINLNIPIKIWPDYNLPKHSFKNPLIIYTSFSGDTAETVSSYLSGKKFIRAVVTTGGQLKKIAEKDKVPLALFEAGNLQPRQATGFCFYAILGLLKNTFPKLKVLNMDKSINTMKNQLLGKELADRLAKKIIMIYTTSNNSHLAYNWKIRLNETSKALAFYNIVPEMCHNEIVSFDNDFKNFICIFLNDSNDNPENKKRIKIISQLLKNRNIDYLNINLKGKNVFQKVFQSINLADWLSYYLALNNNQNPEDIKIINQLKKSMA